MEKVSIKKVRFFRRDYIYMRTADKDYAVAFMPEGGHALWEGNIEALIPLDILATSSKASFEDIERWYNVLCKGNGQKKAKEYLKRIVVFMTTNNGRKLYLLNRNTGKLFSCWRVWLCEDENLNNRVRKIVAQTCREGLCTENIRAIKDVLDDVDLLNSAPSSQWRVCWVNRDAASISVTSEGKESGIYLVLL